VHNNKGVFFVRKLKAHQVEVLKVMINEGETVFEIDGTQYEICIVAENDIPITTSSEDIEKDSELGGILLQAKQDIKAKNYFSSEEMREMILRGEL
jgi:hypothetical protein